MGYYYAPYVPIAKRRANAQKKMDKLRKKGQIITPIARTGRKIARTFWGKGWCDHIESFSDYENRLPRGRMYVRNGSVCHLEVNRGEVKAMVSGSELYHVTIDISTLSKKKWEAIKTACTGHIGSLLDLLQGTLSDGVMAVVSERSAGLFPQNQEIKLHCDCFDGADMCKHVAAVLYGVGARLDEDPKALFLLRGVDHEELIDVSTHVIDETLNKGIQKRVEDDRLLGELFGIDLGDTAALESLPLDTVNEAPQSERARQRRKITTTSKKKGATETDDKGKTHIPLPRYYSGFSLKNLRQTLGLTQKEMAKTVEIIVATLAKYEKLGRKKVHFSKANTEKKVNRLWRKNRVSR